MPTTVEELSTFLTGNTQFDNVDDLLIAIGRQNDRSMLHALVSKLFNVPQKVLVDAEEDRKALIPRVLDAVEESRRRAKDAMQAATSVRRSSPKSRDSVSESTAWPKPSIPMDTFVKSVVNGTEEFADPEHVCLDCLPVYGDEIIGTKPANDPDSIAKVHRVGCPHAQRAINTALSEIRRPANSIFNFALGQRLDSVSLRKKSTTSSRMSASSKRLVTAEVPVKLQWSDFSGPDDQTSSFLCEVVVHAEDRKLLLADCSEVVSELSEIVKTGSQTTKEHATLVFLVKVFGLEDLQDLMNSLRQIRSVMSVERRVSLFILDNYGLISRSQLISRSYQQFCFTLFLQFDIFLHNDSLEQNCYNSFILYASLAFCFRFFHISLRFQLRITISSI